MKRLLASLIASALVLSSVPAQAQVALGRVSLQTGIGAPTPVPGGLVAPANAVTLSLSAPALAVSLTPAPYAPMPNVSYPQAKATPVQPVSGAPLLPASRDAAPLDVLRTVASPERAPVSGAAFDGALNRSAAATVEPPSDPKPAAAPRRNLLQRYRDSRNKTPLQNAFGKAMFATTIGAVAAPILWGMAPAMKAVYALTFADLLMLAVIIPLSMGTAIWRKLHSAPQTAAKPPPSRRAKLLAVTAGVILGLGFSAVPYYTTGPMAERVNTVMNDHRAAADQKQLRMIRGGVVEEEAIATLSKNPVGREILNKLRDRGGAIRLPTFFIAEQDGSYAYAEGGFDGVYLSQKEVTQRGWTVEQFLKDPALQRQLIREMQSVVAHELVHATQFRRAPWVKGYFRMAVEHEYEAFIRQHFYVYEMLKADPTMVLHGEDDDYLESPATDLDAFLSGRDELYPKDIHLSEPAFQAYLAKVRAEMPAHRVDVFLLLAERAEKQNRPGLARMYKDKAAAASKLVASR